MTATETPVLEALGVQVELDDGSAIIEGVDLRLRAGEILGLVGESGSGKTTMALSIFGYMSRGVKRTAGHISLAGESLDTDQASRRARGRLVSYVPQNPGTALNPSMRVAGSVEDILRAHRRGAEGLSELPYRLFERVGLPGDHEFGRRYPHQLSGGQQQRVCIAGALAPDPVVVVLDEPTTGLDVVTQDRILKELLRLRDEQNVAMLYITHDLAVVAQIATRIAVMYAGNVVEEGPASAILRHPRHPYTRGLMASTPDHVRPRELDSMPGIAMGVGERPTGCPFAPRCPQRTDECEAERPGLEETSPGHRTRCIHWEDTPAVEWRPLANLTNGATSATTVTNLLDPATAPDAAKAPDAANAGDPANASGATTAPDAEKAGDPANASDATTAPDAEKASAAPKAPDAARANAADATTATDAAKTRAVLEVEHLKAEYRMRHGHVVAASDISFTVERGGSVALVGESGSGKTTIARVIAGLHPLAAGQVLLDGAPLPALARSRTLEQRRRIQIIFQNPAEALNPRHTVAESIARPARMLQRLNKQAADAAVSRLLESVRLPARLGSRYSRELSGGERQRVAIARALAAGPEIMVCDEVTSALDVSVQAVVLELIRDLRRDLGVAVVFITHDLGVVATVAERVLVLEKGLFCEQGKTAEVLTSPKHAYTQRLLAAAPSLSAAIDSWEGTNTAPTSSPA